MGYVYDDSRGTGKKRYGIAFNDVDGSWIRRREPKAKKSQALGILKSEEDAVIEAKEAGFPSLQAYKLHLKKTAQEAERSAVTFESFSKVYLDHVESRIPLGKVKQITLDRYRDLMRLHILPYFCADKTTGRKRMLTEIDCTLIEAYRDERLTKSKAAKGTVCQEISILSGLFKLAMKQKKVPMHPIWGLVEKPTLDKRKPRYLKADERTAVLSKLKEPIRSAVLISMNTGLRSGELAALTWADVDRERRTITIPGERRKRGIPLEIPYNDDVEVILDRLSKLPARFKSPYVITSPRRKTRYKRFNNTSWRKARKDAGVKCRWHDLRSHCGSMLGQNRRTGLEVKDLLGQSSLQSTEKYITMADNLRDAVQAINGQNPEFTTPIATPKAEPKAERQEPDSKAAVNS